MAVPGADAGAVAAAAEVVAVVGGAVLPKPGGGGAGVGRERSASMARWLASREAFDVWICCERARTKSESGSVKAIGDGGGKKGVAMAR